MFIVIKIIDKMFTVKITDKQQLVESQNNIKINERIRILDEHVLICIKDGELVNVDSTLANKEFTDNDLEKFQQALNDMLSSHQFKEISGLSLKEGKVSEKQISVASVVAVVALAVAAALLITAACILMPVLILPAAAIIFSIFAAIKFFNNKSIASACNKTNESFANSLGFIQKNGGCCISTFFKSPVSKKYGGINVDNNPMASIFPRCLK